MYNWVGVSDRYSVATLGYHSTICSIMGQKASLMNTHHTPDFATRLLAWFDQHGRKDLPWQQPVTPYRVWISEIMLQQTQVTTVIPYFLAFMQRFPDIQTLAVAEQTEVLSYWSGLGYYARARNLHQAAQQMMAKHQGLVPADADALIALPGIGKSTAHAILSLAYHQPTAICDGNVRRVLARWLALDAEMDKPIGQVQAWQAAEALQSQQRPADHTQAMMDLGATLCTRSRPRCADCPLQADCAALALQQHQGVAVTSFPRKSRKSAKPEKHCAMYLLQNAEGKIWLNAPQQQTGLWGGLYQLPQFLPDALVQSADTLLPLPPTQHIFTHFKLHIQPYLLTLSAQQTEQLVLAETGLWYEPNTQPAPARPAIVDKLVAKLIQ